MASRIKQFLSPPVFDDQEQTRTAKLLHTILLITLACGLTVPVILTLVDPYGVAVNSSIMLILTVSTVGLMWMSHRGYVKLAGLILAFILFIIVTYTIFMYGGIHDPTIYVYMLIIVIAGLLLGETAAVIFGLLSILTSLSGFYVEKLGYFMPEFTPTNILFPLVIVMVLLSMTTFLMRFVARTITKSFEESRLNQDALLKSNLELQSVRETLEERVADRTRDLEQRNRQMWAFQAASAAIACSLDIDTVLEIASREMTSLLDAEICLVFGWNPNEDSIRLLKKFHPDTWEQSVLLKDVTSLADRHITKCVLTDRYIQQLTPDQMNATATEIIYMQDLGVASLLMIPMVVQDRVTGIIKVMNRIEKNWDDQRMLYGQLLANQSAGAIDNAQLYKQAQQEIAERNRAERIINHRNQELELFKKIIAASTETQDVNAILETTCRELAKAFGVSQATVAMLNKEKTTATITAEYLVEGRPSALNSMMSITGNPIFHHLFVNKAPLVIYDAQNDQRLLPIHEFMVRRGTRSLLLVPLMVNDDLVGALTIEAVQARLFSAGEISLAWNVADQVGNGLTQIRLIQRQRRLNAAIEQAGEGIIVTDAEWIIVYANPAYEQVSGYSQSDLIGASVLRIFDPATDDMKALQEMQKTISSGRVWYGRLTSAKNDGSLYVQDITIGPVLDDNGETTSFVATIRDVTREIQLETQYQQSQKMQAVGQLTGGVAHDFNNLLTAINGFAELLKMRMDDDDPFRNLVDNILRSGNRAATLVRQLLAFSRKQIVEPKVLNLNVTVTEMDKMLQRIIGENIRMKTKLAQDLWSVKIDLSQIEQIIVNLAVNARDAMPDGGELTIKTENVNPDELDAVQTDLPMGEYVCLCIEDTGIGMGKDIQARIFEPFFTTKEAGKGTGLGLATVFGIVKQNKGDIQVHSAEGAGCIFKIYLPRTLQDAKADMQDAQPEIPYGRETILLVEDDPGVRSLAEHMLRRQGYTVLSASNGQRAIQVAQVYNRKIDLLFTDVVMPKMNGKVLADQFTSRYPDTKVLYTTGYTDDVIAQYGILSNNVAMLSKPFSAISLAQKIREVLDVTPSS